MLFIRRILIPIIALLAWSSVFSQETNPFTKGTFKEEQSFIYKNDGAFGINLHSNGWGVNYTRGRELTVTQKLIIESDFVSIKHPKEYSINSPYGSDESYVYGKASSFMVLRTGFGMHNAIFPKAEKGGVDIRYLYSGGISWGFAKPVYLQVIDIKTQTIKEERFDPEKHSYDNIYGSASFFRGLSQTRIIPGIYAKAGLNFEFGPYDDAVRSIEVGAIFDAYLQKIPIFAVIQGNDVNKNTFLSFYVMVSWGKRW